MNDNSMGSIIRGRRRRKGWTLAQLSKLSGVSTAHIGRIEKGQRSPSGYVLRKLAGPLGFSEVELLKLAGFLSQDDSDKRIERLRQELKDEIAKTLALVWAKIDGILGKGGS